MVFVKDLSFSYTGAEPFILNRLNMQIGAGEYVSVVGDNGSGKSTLMRLILGLLKPVGGTVRTSAERIGYVPQRGDGVPGFPITVREMLDSYRRLLDIRDRGAVLESLAQVGMEDFSRALMDTLSGGQRQKIMIARATLGAPSLIVLDEPSTGIDTHSQEEIYRLLCRLNRERGITILSVEHNLAAAVANSTQIYHLHGGHGHICSPAQYARENGIPTGRNGGQ